MAASLAKKNIQILQVNLGKLCNLACVHCHVEAGPTKTAENMDQGTAEAVLALLRTGQFTTLDLTGGAPEMNPYFKMLVIEARKLDIHVVQSDRR